MGTLPVSPLPSRALVSSVHWGSQTAWLHVLHLLSGLQLALLDHGLLGPATCPGSPLRKAPSPLVNFTIPHPLSPVPPSAGACSQCEHLLLGLCGLSAHLLSYCPSGHPLKLVMPAPPALGSPSTPCPANSPPSKVLHCLFLRTACLSRW